MVLIRGYQIQQRHPSGQSLTCQATYVYKHMYICNTHTYTHARTDTVTDTDTDTDKHTNIHKYIRMYIHMYISQSLSGHATAYNLGHGPELTFSDAVAEVRN
jgi:hypothetical protein